MEQDTVLVYHCCFAIVREKPPTPIAIRFRTDIIISVRNLEKESSSCDGL